MPFPAVGGSVGNTSCSDLKTTIASLQTTITWFNSRLADQSLGASQRDDIERGLTTAQSELMIAQRDYASRCEGPVSVPSKPAIAILMVIGDQPGRRASFGDDPADRSDGWFGMSFIVSTLTQYQAIQLNVTRKHRRTDPGSALATGDENFRFTDAALQGFDQLWIFAFCEPGTDPFTADEAAAIHRFMNGGGGVFAAGDHSEIGAPIGSQICRVRKMRKWTLSDNVPGSGVPNDQPNTPRLDTTVKRPGASTVHFHDQSDDIPQSIVPLFVVGTQPHPLLVTTRNGVGVTIEVLPDHMHEGEVVDPAGIDLSATYMLDGQALAEFPSNAVGTQVRPIAVAKSQSHANTIVSDESVHFSSPFNGDDRMFVSIGAYDGQAAGVGRIVVESTWHHFVNLNLLGDKASAAPVGDPSYTGFTSSSQGEEALAFIQDYFINIALWLTPAPKTRTIHAHWLRWVAMSVNFHELLSSTSASNRAAWRAASVYASQRLTRLTGRPWFVQEVIRQGEGAHHTLDGALESFGGRLVDAAVAQRALHAR